ncbi:MAG TPA: TIGR03435 family protein [Granulicella sp.]|jgi:uncharacterized protein (TIGR03435 family)
MMRKFVATVLMTFLVDAGAQSTAPQVRASQPVFDVATVKLVPYEQKTGRYIKMDGPHRFIAKDYTLKLLIAAAYEMNPRTISGGPGWVDSEHFDIVAITPGEVRPSRPEQMAMLRGLLTERFKLAFHRQEKEFSIYELTVAKGKPKLKASTAAPDEPAAVISTVYPQKIMLPARNASMDDFASLLQRAILDRPVVNKTGLTGKYDFDLEWAPDETQLNGDVSAAPADTPSAPLFTAVQEQLGLKLEATRGPVQAIVVDGAEKPLEN